MKFAATFDYVDPLTNEVIVKAGYIFKEDVFEELVELGFDEFYLLSHPTMGKSESLINHRVNKITLTTTSETAVTVKGNKNE